MFLCPSFATRIVNRNAAVSEQTTVHVSPTVIDFDTVSPLTPLSDLSTVFDTMTKPTCLLSATAAIEVDTVSKQVCSLPVLVFTVMVKSIRLLLEVSLLLKVLLRILLSLLM